MRLDVLDGLRFGDVPGWCIGFVDSGEPAGVHSYGGGTTSSSALSASTLWEAASLSKPVVALAALAREAAEPGFLDRPLLTGAAAFGADDDPRWRQLSIRSLLLHTGGLPNWRPAGGRLRFAHDPGTPGYSGEGYELVLAELVARSGRSSHELLDRHLRALGLHHSSFTPSAVGDVAIGHDESGARLPKTWPRSAKAAGSLHTTATDYLELLAAVV